MAIREIRVVPDPVLRTPCDEIKEITPAVRRLVDDLLETVDDPGRAGLSANQIGVSLRAFSYNIDGKVGYVLNPVLEEKSGEQYGDEGCLSVPDLWYKTRRADYARVRGIDLDGNEVVLEGSGLMGRMRPSRRPRVFGSPGKGRTPRSPALHAQSSGEVVHTRLPLAGAVERSETEGGSAGTARNSPQSPTATAPLKEGSLFFLVPAPCYSRNLCATRQRTQSLASGTTQYCQPAHNKFASCSRRPVSVGCTTRETGGVAARRCAWPGKNRQ